MSRITELEKQISLLQAELDHNRQLFDSKFSSSSAALQLALDENNHRLETMNGFRGANADVLNKMIPRAEAEAALSAMENKVTTEIKTIREKIEEFSKPKYIIILSAIPIFLVLIGGMWTVTGLKIDNAISPIVVFAEQFKVTQSAQERELTSLEAQLKDTNLVAQTTKSQLGESKIDRAQLNERLQTAENNIVTERTERHQQNANISNMITRLNVWADFLHAKVFPKNPTPPLKQP